MANNTSERMHSSSLSEGDQLVQINLDSWSGRIVTETNLTVRKVTKTRVVCDTHFGRECRILLDKDGWVQNRFEGDTYHHVRVFTPDDAKLAYHRRRHNVEELKGDANKAVKEWSGDGSSPAKAREAAQALIAYADARDAIDAEEKSQ